MSLNDYEREILKAMNETKRKLDLDEVLILSLVASMVMLFITCCVCLASETVLKFRNNGLRSTTAIELNYKKN